MQEAPGEEAAIAACQDIKGWLNDEEAICLYRLAHELGPLGSILEIGSFHGKSTIAIALAAKAVGSRVISVDPHEGINYWQGDIRPLPHLGGPSLDDFQRNLRLAKVSEIVESLVMSSAEAFALDEGLDTFSFVFVDGNHGYEEVRRDFDLWSQRLIIGGVIAFHDAAGKIPGPPRVVAEVKKMERYEFVSLVNQLAWFRKLA